MVSVTANVGTCRDFMDETGERLVSIVISPVRVVEDFGEHTEKMERIFWGCNRYFACQNPACEYSARHRNERRQSKESAEHK